ncbi:hypothetical protein [Brevundimonas sp.]|jgi:hypothetical protein|uniref:hypothetical protein n=1 Tax=Brevundimonas sp. TaxID=1871086 RepID=UPI0037C06801
MDREQTKGREKNGAMPGGRPDETTPDEDIIRTGRRAAQAAGPDGPDAGVIGETFKSSPGDRKTPE